jgi:hypothetical protein
MGQLNKVLIGVGAGVAIAGGAIAGWYFRPGSPASRSQILDAAALVPDQTLMATFVTADTDAWTELESLNLGEADTLVSSNLQDFALMAPVLATHSQLWDQLAQIGTPQTQILTSQHLQELDQRLLSLGGLAYEADVEPWVKSMAVSILPPTELRGTDQMNMLLILELASAGKVQEVLQKLKAQSSAELQVVDYQGVQILSLIQDQQAGYGAVIGNYLVFSPERRSVELAIDTSQNKTSIKAQYGDQFSLNNALKLERPLAQVYVPNYGDLINQILVASADAAPLAQDTLEAFQQVQALAAGVGLEDNGVRFRVMVQGAEDQAIEFSPVPGNVVQYFPADTVALLNGQNLQGLWSSVGQPGDPESGESGNPLANLNEFDFGFDLDLEEDLLSWMTGEFALGIVPVEAELMSQLGVSGALVMESGNRATTNSTLLKLDEQAKRTSLTIDKEAVGDAEAITKWRLPQGLFLSPFQNEVFLGYGWLNTETLFVALGGSLVDSMTDPAAETLADNPSFQAVSKALPKQNSGYFYLNLAALDDLDPTSPLNQQLDNLPPEAVTALNSIQSVGLTTSQYDRQTSQVDLFMVLEPSAETAAAE